MSDLSKLQKRQYADWLKRKTKSNGELYSENTVGVMSLLYLQHQQDLQVLSCQQSIYLRLLYGVLIIASGSH